MRTADRYGKWQTTEALSSPAAVAAPCPGAAERRMTNDRYRGVGSRNDIYAVWSNEIPDYYRGCAAIFRIKHREVHYNILFGVYLFILFSFPCFIFYEVNFFFRENIPKLLYTTTAGEMRWRRRFVLNYIITFVILYVYKYNIMHFDHTHLYMHITLRSKQNAKINHGNGAQQLHHRV